MKAKQWQNRKVFFVRMTNDLRFLKQQPSPTTTLSEKTLTFGFQNFYLKQFLQIFSEFDNSIFRLVFLGLIK